ncbi:DUF4440 domain-containing protein [Agromyces fucosus]|uniref:DUF4440 domain-containing protein n=1 Tax=Agromyces fucosus TaxID=41985 RepID=A0A4V1QSA6_9MICO|nr:DUF4440 domain-containing protein [Agromyces fucosus]RXZ47723.1 DUF4440 domain-containing protein [Agromyces fucosus]
MPIHQPAQDETELDSIAFAFFSAFSSSDLKPVDLAELRQLFLPGATIVAVASDGAINRYEVEGFVEPREALLTGGRLLGFSEREITADTRIFGDIAQRWSLYSKTGTLDGGPADGWGRKATHFVRTSAGWRISAIVWQDGAAGSEMPTAFS